MQNLLEREVADHLVGGLRQGPTRLMFAGGVFELDAEQSAAVGEALELVASGRVLVTKDDERLSAEQAAEFLGVSRPTIYKWIEAGLLEDTPVGSHHRISVESAQALYDERVARARGARLLMEQQPEDPRVIAARARARARVDELR